jgi:signal peptidase II
MPAVVMIAAAVYIVRDKDQSAIGMMQKVSLTLIAAGGVGNMIDRFMFGHVTDMISFSIFPPVFNVADIAVTCGCAMLILSLIIGERKSDGDR